VGLAVAEGAAAEPLGKPAEERLARAGARNGRPCGTATAQDESAIFALVDELAVLAADLWSEGRLEDFPADEESPDADADAE